MRTTLNKAQAMAKSVYSKSNLSKAPTTKRNYFKRNSLASRMMQRALIPAN